MFDFSDPGMTGFMGTISPKSYYWYTVLPLHYLVQAEESGIPGQSSSKTVLQSYKGILKSR
ncbi:MAG: hypothetical protein DRP59_08180 [Spirochaetes bacterium]|nr:MAG: hypothetical protein DRP59_08180 [Spirochaetota bacterium]